MRRRGRHRRQCGFTLVEMLLSVALLSVVLGLFGGLFFRLEKTSAAIAVLEDAEDGGTARRFITAALEGSRPLLRPGDAGRRQVHFTGEAQRVTFAGIAAGDHEVGGVYETTLRLDEAGQLVMLRHPLGWGDGPQTPKVLLRGVASLSFAYHPCPTPAGEARVASWIGQDHLPSRITLSISFRRGDTRTWPALFIFPAASACPLRG